MQIFNELNILTLLYKTLHKKIADILNIYIYLHRNYNNFLIISREIHVTITKVHVYALLFFLSKIKTWHGQSLTNVTVKK